MSESRCPHDYPKLVLPVGVGCAQCCADHGCEICKERLDAQRKEEPCNATT